MRGVHPSHPRWATGHDWPCLLRWSSLKWTLQRQRGQPVVLSVSLVHWQLVTWRPWRVVAVGASCRGAALLLAPHCPLLERCPVAPLQAVVGEPPAPVWVVVVLVVVGSLDPQGEH